VPDVRFSAAQGSYLARKDRLTHYLFYPATAPLRGDARFAGLVRDLGLDDYWRRSRTVPDYRRN
ncbi:hypothetical protein, partial [Novosphingobium sp. 9U]|uniref:hypothetical protein n=1 Tax=Novosphingobium sp. 9U TaxID=2653158 RepID=UPI001F1D35DA